jgi:hypothetical protein
VAEGRGEGGLQVLVAAEALEGDPFDCAFLLVLDVICDYQYDLFDLVLYELEGAFDLFLICLFGEAFAGDLHPLPQALLFSSEGFSG